MFASRFVYLIKTSRVIEIFETGIYRAIINRCMLK
jgi:hypothetical protein